MQLLTDTSRKRPLPVTENKVHNLSIRKWIRNPTRENEFIPKIIEIQFSCKIMRAFLTKLVLIRWLNIAQGLFLGIYGPRRSRGQQKRKKKKQGQHSVISTKQAWFHNGLIILSNLTRTFSCVINAGNPEQVRRVHLGNQSDHITSSCPLADSAIYIIRTLKSLTSVHAPAGKFD